MAIIAAYAGCGKSYLAKQRNDILDLCSMPYRYFLPESSGQETEETKAAPYLVLDPFFRATYDLAILEAMEKYKHVLIAPNWYTLFRLKDNYGIEAIVCYPEKGAKKEYQRRYEARKNTAEFMKYFVEQWDERIERLSSGLAWKCCELKSGEYLSDVLERVEELEKQPNAAMIDKIVDSEEDIILQFFEFHREDLYEWKKHIDDYSVFLTVYLEKQTCAVKLPYHLQETRDYIYQIGKKAWEQGHRVMVFDANDVIEEDSTMWDGSLRKKVPVTICESIEEFESFVFAKERKANE